MLREFYPLLYESTWLDSDQTEVIYIYNTLIKSHILKVSYPSLELIKVQRDFQYEDLKKITHLYYDI